YAIHSIEIMQAVIDIYLSNSPKEDREKKIKELLKPEEMAVQFQKTFNVQSKQDSDLFQVDIRTRRKDGKYIAMLYEISKDLRKTNKCLTVGFEDPTAD